MFIHPSFDYFSQTIQKGYYYQTNKPNEEDFEAELRKNYAHNIEGSASKRKDMVAFMTALKKGEVPDERMDDVLHAGKGDMKRHYKVDGRFYGTEEGVAAKKRMEEELRLGKKKRKKKKKKAAAEAKAAVEEAKVVPPPPPTSNTTKSVVALGVVGAAAAVATIFMGGGRSR